MALGTYVGNTLTSASGTNLHVIFAGCSLGLSSRPSMWSCSVTHNVYSRHSSFGHAMTRVYTRPACWRSAAVHIEGLRHLPAIDGTWTAMKSQNGRDWERRLVSARTRSARLKLNPRFAPVERARLVHLATPQSDYPRA